MAPTMRAMEFKYKNDVNFVTMNGVAPENGKAYFRLLALAVTLISSSPLLHKQIVANIVNAFGVDGIPHVAFIDRNAAVLTALVGAVPEKMMTSEISALVKVRCIQTLLHATCYRHYITRIIHSFIHKESFTSNFTIAFHLYRISPSHILATTPSRIKGTA